VSRQPAQARVCSAEAFRGGVLVPRIYSPLYNKAGYFYLNYFVNAKQKCSFNS